MKEIDSNDDGRFVETQVGLNLQYGSLSMLSNDTMSTLHEAGVTADRGNVRLSFSIADGGEHGYSHITVTPELARQLAEDIERAAHSATEMVSDD